MGRSTGQASAPSSPNRRATRDERPSSRSSSGKKPASRGSRGSASKEKEIQPAEPTWESIIANQNLYEDGAVVKVSRQQVYEERAKKLSARYGLEFQPSAWQLGEGEVLRTEKPVRMRARRQCLYCQTVYGGRTRCPSCDSDAYSRFYTRQGDEEQNPDAAGDQAEGFSQSQHPSQDPALQISGRSGSCNMVKKETRMRVRRFCHECDASFGVSRVCSNCGHKRCSACTRAPEPRKRHPTGYPRDEPGPDTEAYYACHECRTTYPANPTPQARCLKCSHRICTECMPVTQPDTYEPTAPPAPDNLDLGVDFASLSLVAAQD